MPDISLCTNQECPLKRDCFRFNAIPNPLYQSIMKYTFYVENGKTKCDDMIKMTKADKDQIKRHNDKTV